MYILHPKKLRSLKMKVTEAHMEVQENKDILEKVKEVLGK
ncbi:hypothetical protein SCAPIOD110047 [Staphylococcus capitis]|nr:hypothetical protein CR01_150050 [Staphylococcus capitis CR01]CQD26198.1 hypothetical protein SCAPIOD110047 [Staphylococcus capitis]CRN10912.1 hypothetical protein BN1517130050 [Staphylococcus capitis]